MALTVAFALFLQLGITFPAPLAPVGATHYIVLTWTASTSTGQTGFGNIGYFLYRGTSSGGESGTPINATPAAVNCSGGACTYSDYSVSAGQTYYYKAAAYDESSGLYSGLSNETSATVP